MSKSTNSNCTIFGNNIDKNNLEKTKKSIAKDKDIRKLIFYAKGRMFILLSISIFVLSGVVKNYLVGFTEYTFNFKAENIREMLLSIAASIIIMMTIYLDFKSLSEESMNLINYIRYIFIGSLNPLYYWNVNVGSVSDTQISGALVRSYDGKIDIYYAGEPYFKIKAIDSVYLRFYGNDVISKRKIKKIYRRRLHKFYVSTYIGNADQSLFISKERKLQVSDAVFGILFMSQFLKDIYDEYYNSIKDKKNSDSRIPIWCTIAQKENNELAETYVKYCTSPDYFEWLSGSKNKIKEGQFGIEICNISIFNEKFMGNVKDATIRVPVKRYVGVPSNGFVNRLKEKRVLMPGGAEQNLALQYFVSRYIWDKGTIKEGAILGIAENSFFDYHECDFLIGTEGLVYGITDTIKGRLVGESKHVSELIYFCYDNLQFINVYGYSAIATKMSLIIFCNRLLDYEKSSPKDLNSVDYIPGKALNKMSFLTYVPNIEANCMFLDSNMVRDWDNGVINSEEGLQDWYSKYKEKYVIGGYK